MVKMWTGAVTGPGRRPSTMREVLPELMEWWRAGDRVAVASVVSTFRSAPRPVGTSLLRGPDGSAVGSVSGGCVEAAVHEECALVLESGRPALVQYGIADDDAFAVGLTCGGIIDIFCQEVSRDTHPELEDVSADLAAGRPVALATVVQHPEPAMVGRRLVIRPDGDRHGTLGSARFDDAVHDDALGALATGSDATLTYGPDGERRGQGTRVLVWAFAPKPRMLVFGAIDFAAAVAEVGTFLGYRVTVCDARSLFATRTRFPHADEVIVDWPHRYLAAEQQAERIDARTVLVALTHDPKFDVPLLACALRLPQVAYVGAMGSRRTHLTRLDQLRAAGLSEHELARLSSPIGLDLGARTPAETAVSIAAEIVASRWNRPGGRLTASTGPIHHDADPATPDEPGARNVGGV